MASPITASIRPARSIDTLPDIAVFGASPAMLAIRLKVEKVATANVPILIQGPSGAGKEVIARMIHRRSHWASGPFVKVNCPAIPGSLLESELFGYEKGSFTGATEFKPGRVELANGGTLFLDEIAEIDLGLQAKLLQLLQDNRFWRIGGSEDIHVEVRVICATCRQLEQEIAVGRFREDLFYRVNVVKIQIPPLRDRLEDLPMLIAHFLEFYSSKYKIDVRPLSPPVMRLLQKHHWPGNVRELANLIERYVILGSEESVANELREAPSGRGHAAKFSADGRIALKSMTRRTVQELERKIILGALVRYRWNRKLVAKELQISYRTLLYKIRQAGLPSRRPASREGDPAAVLLPPAD
jgi:two-component system, NtrC family, response regulator AtoC